MDPPHEQISKQRPDRVYFPRQVRPVDQCEEQRPIIPRAKLPRRQTPRRRGEVPELRFVQQAVERSETDLRAGFADSLDRPRCGIPEERVQLRDLPHDVPGLHAKTPISVFR